MDVMQFLLFPLTLAYVVWPLCIKIFFGVPMTQKKVKRSPTLEERLEERWNKDDHPLDAWAMTADEFPEKKGAAQS